MIHIIDDLVNTKTEIKPGIWVIARPYKSSVIKRIKNAWKVLKGEAEAVKFIDQ